MPRENAPVRREEEREKRADTVAGVKVVCRLRPMNDREKKSGTVPAATASTERREVAVVRMLGGTRKVSSTFHFDDVLTSFSSQAEVFSSTLEPLVGEVLAGYEATAFAYGQTGTGKTYTMEGDVDSDDGRGLVPRAATAVIEALAGGKYSEHAVTVSYLEIYNEELSDLLAPTHFQQKLDLKDSGGGRGVCCQGLSEVSVASVSDILELVCRAQERRRVAETRVNARSSRSHSIFTLKVRCRQAVANGELENVGKLHLVDLAGSECAKKAAPDPTGIARPGAQEEERERKSINQSLLTLGRVITALRDGSGRVPYRDSKLTRLLQDSLGGRCKTVIIATISPALGAVEETISTLTYAEQASGIQNRPVASSLLRTLRGPEVRGEGSITGDFAELEMKVVYLTQEVEEAQAALARKYREAQDQAERAQCAEERLAEAEQQLQAARLSLEEGAFVRLRLAAAADRQHDTATRLSAALQASQAQGEELTTRLVESRSTTLASRAQAREVCAAAEAESAAAAEAIHEASVDAAKALAEAFAAHEAGTVAGDEALQEQQRLLAALRASVHSCEQRLAEQQRAVAREACDALSADEVAAKDALDTIEAAAASVIAAVGKTKADAGAATARDFKALTAQAETLRGQLDSGRAELSVGAQGLVEGLASARSTAEAGHELSCKRLAATLQEPLSSLCVALQPQRAQSHAAAAAALRDEGAEEAQRARGQVQGLLEMLAAAAAAHGQATQQRPRALGAAHEALRASLDSHGEAVEGKLRALASSVDANKVGLAGTSQDGQAAVASALAAADAELSVAWEGEARTLAALHSTLADAAARQRAGHAAEAIQCRAADAAAALAAALATNLHDLTLARQRVATQLAELQQQRAAEQAALGLLSQQREALQLDVAGQRDTLDTLKGELASTRGELAALEAAQEQRRSNALQAIMSVVTAELEGLGQGITAGAKVLDGRLDAAIQLAATAQQTAAEAEQRSDALSREVAAVASSWSQAVAASCDDVATAQESAREAQVRVEAAGVAAGEQLGSLGVAGSEWGEACDRVAGLIDEAEAQRSGLSEALEALRPAWGATRQRGEAAAREWREGSQRIEEGLAQAALDAAATGLPGLRSAVERRCEAAVEEARMWRCDCEAHGTSLAALSELGNTVSAEAEAAEQRRANSAENVVGEAEDLSRRWAEACASSETMLAAARTHGEAAVVDFTATDTALATAAATVTALQAQASAAFDAGSEAVTALCGAQVAASRAACEAVAASSDQAAAAAKAGGAVAAAHRKAALATLGHAREQWQRSEELREAALAERAGEAESAAMGLSAEAAGQRLRVELEAGRAAKEHAAAVVEGLALGAGSRVKGLQVALRAGVSKAPLAAFSEELQGMPERLKAPEIKVLRCPSEQELVQEFQRGRFDGVENLGSKMPGREAAGPRRALAELNN